LNTNLFSPNQTIRRNGLRVLACALVFLGACVFAWGLRYKLSLYDPPHSISHRMPAAKLLTSRERPEAGPIGIDRAARTGAPGVSLAWALALIFAGSTSLFPGSLRRAGWRGAALPIPSHFAISFCYTRPPPQSC
jgi:hypothetical protein